MAQAHKCRNSATAEEAATRDPGTMTDSGSTPFIDLPDRIPGLRAQARSDRPWYQFKNTAADEAELFLYDEIGGWGTFADEFVADLNAITAPKIRLRVNSPGGSVFEGLACANALRSHPAEVTVQIDGLAASIASVIAMAADRVIVQPQAMLMLHDAAGACLGNAQDMKDMAALLDKISGNIADAYSAKAGGTRDHWRTQMRAETWFTAEEAVEAGLADEMLSARKAQRDEAEPEMRSFDLTAYGYSGPSREPAPKPGPPPAQPEKTTLTIDIGSVLGDAVVEQLRATVLKAAEPVAPSAPTAPAEVPVVFDQAPEPAPSEPIVQPEPEPDPDPWTVLTAHLTTPSADPWADLTAHLIPAASPAATEA